MNTYLKDQLLQLAEKSERSAKHDHERAQEYREDGDLDQAIWWEGLADKARNRAARLRGEIDGHS